MSYEDSPTPEAGFDSPVAVVEPEAAASTAQSASPTAGGAASGPVWWAYLLWVLAGVLIGLAWLVRDTGGLYVLLAIAPLVCGLVVWPRTCNASVGAVLIGLAANPLMIVWMHRSGKMTVCEVLAGFTVCDFAQSTWLQLVGAVALVVAGVLAVVILLLVGKRLRAGKAKAAESAGVADGAAVVEAADGGDAQAPSEPDAAWTGAEVVASQQEWESAGLDAEAAGSLATAGATWNDAAAAVTSDGQAWAQAGGATWDGEAVGASVGAAQARVEQPVEASAQAQEPVASADGASAQRGEAFEQVAGAVAEAPSQKKRRLPWGKRRGKAAPAAADEAAVETPALAEAPTEATMAEATAASRDSEPVDTSAQAYQAATAWDQPVVEAQEPVAWDAAHAQSADLAQPPVQAASRDAGAWDQAWQTSAPPVAEPVPEPVVEAPAVKEDPWAFLDKPREPKPRTSRTSSSGAPKGNWRDVAASWHTDSAAASAGVGAEPSHADRYTAPSESRASVGAPSPAGASASGADSGAGDVVQDSLSRMEAQIEEELGKLRTLSSDMKEGRERTRAARPKPKPVAPEPTEPAEGGEPSLVDLAMRAFDRYNKD
ncbi:MAG: hypothetical protein LBR32_07070 [Propionibacteriaceae bacterium]|jgi:hypothetical protein|nr:hypothetical protein [Propionibacteriaceae bacterium]